MPNCDAEKRHVQQTPRPQGAGHRTLNPKRTMTMTPNAQQQQRIDDAPESWRRILTKVYTRRATPSAAIWLRCLECKAYDRPAIEACNLDTCPLWNYRPFCTS